MFQRRERTEDVYQRVKEVIADLDGYCYEHIFIDNASTDNTRQILRRLAAEDRNVKLIFNTRNFGRIRPSYYAILQALGDAVIPVVADLQAPPHRSICCR